MSFEIKKFDEAIQGLIDTMRTELIELINPVMNHIAKFGDSRERHNAISRFEEAISWIDKCIVMFEPQAAPVVDAVEGLVEAVEGEVLPAAQDEPQAAPASDDGVAA